jgi:hypothetical protein
MNRGHLLPPRYTGRGRALRVDLGLAPEASLAAWMPGHLPPPLLALSSRRRCTRTALVSVERDVHLEPERRRDSVEGPKGHVLATLDALDVLHRRVEAFSKLLNRDALALPQSSEFTGDPGGEGARVGHRRA